MLTSTPTSSLRLGRFDAQERLGEGGFGVVYRVLDPLRPGRDFALKVLRASRSAEVPRLIKELRAAQAVEHRALVGAIEVGVLEAAEGSVYLLLELAEGRPLAPPVPVDGLLQVAEEILAALETIHAAGWRHGDVQPGNILVHEAAPGRWSARLLDFGLATETALGTPAHRPHAAGAPRFLPPEALRGLPVDHRGDLYSLGAVLYDCLRNGPAVETGERLLRTRQGKFFAEAVDSELPEPLGRLIRRLLEPNPLARLATAREGLEILGRAAHHPLPTPNFDTVDAVGRESIQRAIAGAIATVLGPRSRPQLLLVEGSRGLGKTKLLREARLQAFAQGLRPRDWTELVAAATGGESNAASAEAKFDASASQITAALLTTPSALFVDDADQLPAEEIRLLRSIVERVRSAHESSRLRSTKRPGLTHDCFPLLLVCSSPMDASRNALNAAWTRWASLAWVSRFQFAPWSLAEGKEFLARTLRPRHALGPLAELLIEDAGGSPARLRTRLKDLARSGDLLLEDGTWISKRPAEHGLPAFPEESARSRLAWLRLGEAERQTGTLLAVCCEAGVNPEAIELAPLLGRTPAETAQLVQALRQVEILGNAPTPSKESTSWHLDRSRRDLVMRLSGREKRRQARELFAASDLAASAARGSRRTTERFLGRRLADPRTPTHTRVALALRLAELLLARGQSGRAESVLLGALPQTDDATRGRIFALLGEVRIARRDGPGAKIWFQKLAAELAAEPKLNAELQARQLFGQGAAELLAGRLDEAREWVEASWRARPDLPQLANLLGNIQVARGAWQEAESAFTRAIALAEQGGTDREIASARTNFGRLLARRGRLSEATEHHQSAAAAFERAELRAEAANALMNLGTARRRSGNFEAAVEAAGRSLAIRRELGDDAGTALSEANLAILARELGLPGTARRRLRAADEAAHAAGKAATDELAGNLLVLENRALLELDLGSPEEARRWRQAAAERRGPETTPEELHLEAKWISHSSAPEAEAAVQALEMRWPSRPFEARDAPGLAQIACLGAPSPRLASLAKEELERLAASSPRALFHWHLARLAAPRSNAERADSLAVLEARVESFPERLARLEALAHLCRSDAERSVEALERARGLLRKLADEILFDLDPSERVQYRSSPIVLEALAMPKDSSVSGVASEKTLAVLREVFRLNREILAEEDLDALSSKVVDAVLALTGAERGVLFLRRDGRLESVAARSQGSRLDDPERHVSRTVLDRVLEGGKAIIATDAREDLSLRSIASVEELGLRSVLCVPLRLRERITGALYLDNPFERAVFDADDIELTENFCDQAMLAWRAQSRRQEVAGLVRELRQANAKLHGELDLSRRDARRRERSGDKRFHGLTGDSKAMRSVFELVEAVAPTDIPILITGESGTGKELVARAIHQESRRADRPFVAENCAAVPAGLLESTLFGHARGAFTGADSDRQGLFELADGGTLFLDEIAEMPLELQTRLLRVLQEKELRPLGSKRVIKLDVRVLAATNRNAREAVAQGKLREDLYYRLQGAEIRLPSLRERREDVPLLVERFLAENTPPGTTPKRLAPAALEHLLRYPWPGNVRELSNEVRRLTVLTHGEIIGPESLSPQVREGTPLRPAGAQVSVPGQVRPLLEVEKEAILAALQAFDGHRGKAAAALGVSRSTLYLKLREFGASG